MKDKFKEWASLSLMFHGVVSLTMEEDLCRSITKKICLSYARDKIRRAQQLLHRFRSCKCSELGGKDCKCFSPRLQLSAYETGSQSAKNSSHTRNSTERSVETDEGFGSPTVRYRFKYMDQEDAVGVTTYRSGHVPRPLVYSLARRHYMPLDEVYDGIRNPFVLVINNVNFYNTKDPRPRNGAVHDRDNVRAFCEGAGFRTVVEHFDLTKQKMLGELEKIRQTEALIDHDSFICIIMSHGNEEGILGADSQAVPVDYITAKFRGGVCPQLAMKPKLFFLQACRGDIDDDGYLIPRGGQGGHVSPDTGETEEMPVKLPSDADFLIAYSTTKGFVSYRSYTVEQRVAETHGKTLGSWFISCLVQVLQKYSNREDLMTMLTRVNNSMTRQYTVHGRCKQISCQLSMLTKKVYFANYLEETAAAAAI